MTQEALFAVPETKGAMLPPEPPKSVVQAQPLGSCCKCGELAVLQSPGGSVYCQKHGYCGRRTCLKSVEKFVMHPRLGIWVCSCVIKFEKEQEAR